MNLDALHICLFTSLIILILTSYSVFVSIREREKMAAHKFLLSGIVISIPGILIFLLELHILSWIYIFMFLSLVLIFFLPVRIYKIKANGHPDSRIDERDTMFSRAKLNPNSAQFTEYYNRHPERLDQDNHFRSKPGLLSSSASKYQYLSFNAAAANFDIVSHLSKMIDGKVERDKETCNPEHLTKFIKNWGIKQGASGIGITHLKDYHKYSHIGRGPEYGKQVKLNHPYAIAIITEKDDEMVQSAPEGPIVFESSEKYLHTGLIAIQIAEFIRKLGYEARAHIDANYQVVCPLVASDAGLGEIGRMGLLMTKQTGPRARISVVSTNLPLETDTKKQDLSVIDFCNKCKKCANNCPTDAIPKAERKPINGALRWQINSDACYLYWNIVGTDCGQCIRVCPFAHPNNPLHNFVRWGISNNMFFSRLALKLDDFFYGKRPKPKPIPDWIKGS